MLNTLSNFYARISFTRALTVLVLLLLVSYVGLIAFVMSYGAVETETAQAVRDSSAQVSTLEGQYLAASAKLSVLNPSTIGYATPSDKSFVIGKTEAAMAVPGE